MKLSVYEHEAEWVRETIDVIKETCRENKNCTIALSGGSTPKPIYRILGESPDFSLKNTTLFLVDERYVPSDHEQSNQKLITDTILAGKNKPKKSIFFNTSLTIEESIKKYSEIIPEYFDLCILGIGTDGHTASLFPNSAALSETKKKVLHTKNKTGQIIDRLTITFPIIMKSKKLLLLVKGTNKKEILDKLLRSEESIENLPAKKLLDHPNLLIHFCAC